MNWLLCGFTVGGSNPGSRSNSARSSPEWKNTNRRSSTLGLVGGGGDDDQVGLDALMKRMKSLSERREQFTAEEQIKRYIKSSQKSNNNIIHAVMINYGKIIMNISNAVMNT